MIRVLQMIGALEMGGSQALVMNLYRHMDRERIQFDFILDHPDRDDYAAQVRELGGRIYTMPGFHGNVGEIRRSWDSFFKGRPEYKILHSHVRSYASLYLPAAKRNGLKTIIHSHSTSNGSGLSSLVKMALQYPLRYQADVLMSCTREAGVWLYGERACRGENFYILKNGVDTAGFAFNEETRRRYRKELGAENKLVVGHVGRFHEAKNHVFLLDCFAALRNLRPDSLLLLAGDGELRPEIERRISELGLKNHVLLLGNRSDVAELMWAMDVLAFPSKWEGLPVTVMEAQAAGLPCLISDRISVEVDISPLVRRLSIEDPGLWAAELAKPLPRRDVRENIVCAGYDINDSADRLSRLYEKLYREANR